MQKVHFIAIGGAAMHNLAIAISKKNSFLVTGSDDEIYEPSYSRLKENKLLPDKLGWFPEKIHKGLSAVIVGMHAEPDNPELLYARELGLKIYSFPEYLFHSTRSKTRIVVAGSHGKTTTTAMIMFVLRRLRMDPDYMVGASVEGFDNMVRLTYESRITVFEGDEYPTSPLDTRPKFFHYKPHIAVLTGISWDHINIYPDYKTYIQKFREFIEQMEVQGRLIFFEGDENLKDMNAHLRRDIVSFAYNTPLYEIRDGITYLKTKKGEIALKIFGEHNLQNMEAARIACRQVGVTDDQFFSVIGEFPGADNRLQKICSKNNCMMFRDFAHSPSKVRASVKAVKNQFPDKKLIACIELNTYSSLHEDFLPNYSGIFESEDVVLIYYKPEKLKLYQLPELNPDYIIKSFSSKNITVYTEIEQLKINLKKHTFSNNSLLFMTNGTFGGIDFDTFTRELHGE